MVDPRHMKTPPLRVSRPVAACSRCRSLKIGCDGKLPACTPCEKHDKASSCSGANDEFAKGKDRSYVAFLESRQEKLEKSIRQLKEQKGSTASQAAQAAGRQMNHDFLGPGVAPVGGDSKAAKQQEVSDMNSLVSDFGSLAVHATGRSFEGFTGSMSFARLVLTSAARQPMPKALARPLPPRNETARLIQIYIENTFILLPFHSEGSLFRSSNALYENEGRASTDWDHWAVNMALAIASACQSRHSTDHHHSTAVQFAAAALTRVENVMHPGSIMGVQAILFLAEFAMLFPRYFDSWYFVGVASRIVIDLGLHQDPPNSTETLTRQMNLRQRVFYSVYSLERSISMTLGLPFSFSDESASVTLPPIRDDSASSPSSPGVLGLQSLDAALHLFHLRRIQSGWYQDLQSGALSRDGSARSWAVCQETQKWFQQISEYTPSEIKELLELQQLHSDIFVLSQSAEIVTLENFAKRRLFDCCISYAGKMSSLSQNHRNAVFYTFYESIRVEFVGQRFLRLVWAVGEEGPMSPDFLNSILSRNSAEAFSAGNSLEDLYVAKISAAVACIHQVMDILARHSSRWDQSRALYDRFHNASASTLANLKYSQEQFGIRSALNILEGTGAGPPAYQMAPGTATNIPAPQDFGDPSLGRL